MKKFIGVFAVFASLVLMAASAFAQAPDCTDEGKAAMYTEFTANRTSDSAKAYEAAKKYLGCSQAEDQYTAYLKKWVGLYEKEARKSKMLALLYVDKKYEEALALGKQILADEPENVRVIIDEGYGSYLAAASLKKDSFNTDALTYARKAIQLIESGKAPAKWDPFKGKDDTLAYLYDVIGRLELKDNPSGALTSFLKKAQFDTELKKDPWTYYFIAGAYESGPYTKLSADYKACCEGKDESPQSKLLLENINQVVDRMVDAYARAVAAAGSEPKYEAKKKEWMDDLTTWYKFRKGSDAGLPELIASVLSKPLPPAPTPVTALPAAATTSAPAAGSPSTGAATTTTAAPAAVPATAAASPAKPAVSTNGETGKPKPRKHHASTGIDNQRR